MKLKKILSLVLCTVMVLSTMSFTVLAADTDIIEVGTGKTYETWSAAITAATDANNDGAITYHIYGKVMMDSHNINGSAATINIIGMTDDAELSVETAKSTDNGVVYIANDTIETVNFTNIKLSRPNGEWKQNEAHANRFYTVWDSDGSTDLITYTNCVFPNGSSNNQYGGTTEYTNCKFYNSEYYALWIYDDGKTANGVTTNISGCYFEAARGVKTYSENHTVGAAKATTNIDNCEFVIESKPAVVSSLPGTITMTDVDADECPYGLLATEAKDGNASHTLANVTVDGETPAYVAKVGNMVCTDMNYAEAEKTDAKPIEIPVASIGTKYYTSLEDAVAAITDDSTLIINEGEYDVALKIAKNNVTVKANGEVTLTQTPSIKGSNYYIEGIDFKYNDSYSNLSGTGKFVDCDFTANVSTFRYCYAGTGTIEFNGCNLTAGAWAIHFDGAGGLDLVFTDCDITGRVALGSDLGSLTATGTNFNGSYVNIWGTVTGATFTQCDFNNVPYVFTGYDLDNTVEFNDCTTNDEDGIAGLIYGGVDSANAEIKIDGEITTRDAEIDGVYYRTIEQAIEAAQDGDTIDLMGNVIELEGTQQMTIKNKDITITNGTIDITGVDISANAIWLLNNSVLTFNDVNLIGDGYDSAFGVIYLVTTEAGVKFINSTVDLNADGKSGGFVKGDGYMGTVLIDNSDITLVATNRGFISTEVTIQNDSHVSISGDKSLANYGIENAFNICGITLKDTSTIDIKDCYEYGIKIGDAAINIEDTAKVTATGNGIADIAHRTATNTGVLTIGEDAVVEADNIVLNNEVAGEGEIVSKADKVYVQYKKIDSEEGTAKYEIVLAGANAEKINELASADLTFNFVGTPVAGGAMNYTVAPAEGVSLTQLGDRFMFNYDGVTKYEESGAAIVIGTITIDGYGSYTLATAESDKNAVYATEIRDNIVDGFTAAGELVINRDMAADDGMVGEITDGEITVPTRTLTIDITFPNAVENNATSYQDMTVTIVGGTVNETIALGTDGAAYNFTRELPYNTAYTVTVSGAGYRTARYTVTMTEDKTLNFWNNVRDNAMEVEEGKSTSAVTKNFLAGDIVKDNNINIYDLSAVVSYFGTETNRAEYSDYAKYDLNRDGVIDSKDVAYVLVSWNN